MMSQKVRHHNDARRHVIHRNDPQHKRLICDSINDTQHNDIATMMSVVFYLMLLW
jgi:hypothetical protein